MSAILRFIVGTKRRTGWPRSPASTSTSPSPFTPLRPFRSSAVLEVKKNQKLKLDYSKVKQATKAAQNDPKLPPNSESIKSSEAFSKSDRTGSAPSSDDRKAIEKGAQEKLEALAHRLEVKLQEQKTHVDDLKTKLSDAIFREASKEVEEGKDPLSKEFIEDELPKMEQPAEKAWWRNLFGRKVLNEAKLEEEINGQSDDKAEKVEENLKEAENAAAGGGAAVASGDIQNVRNSLEDTLLSAADSVGLETEIARFLKEREQLILMEIELKEIRAKEEKEMQKAKERKSDVENGSAEVAAEKEDKGAETKEVPESSGFALGNMFKLKEKVTREVFVQKKGKYEKEPLKLAEKDGEVLKDEEKADEEIVEKLEEDDGKKEEETAEMKTKAHKDAKEVIEEISEDVQAQQKRSDRAKKAEEVDDLRHELPLKEEKTKAEETTTNERTHSSQQEKPEPRSVPRFHGRENDQDAQNDGDKVAETALERAERYKKINKEEEAPEIDPRLSGYERQSVERVREKRAEKLRKDKIKQDRELVEAWLKQRIHPQLRASIFDSDWEIFKRDSLKRLYVGRRFWKDIIAADPSVQPVSDFEILEHFSYPLDPSYDIVSHKTVKSYDKMIRRVRLTVSATDMVRKMTKNLFEANWKDIGPPDRFQEVKRDLDDIVTQAVLRAGKTMPPPLENRRRPAVRRGKIEWERKQREELQRMRAEDDPPMEPPHEKVHAEFMARLEDRTNVRNTVPGMIQRPTNEDKLDEFMWYRIRKMRSDGDEAEEEEGEDNEESKQKSEDEKIRDELEREREKLIQEMQERAAAELKRSAEERAREERERQRLKKEQEEAIRDKDVQWRELESEELALESIRGSTGQRLGHAMAMYDTTSPFLFSNKWIYRLMYRANKHLNSFDHQNLRLLARNKEFDEMAAMIEEGEKDMRARAEHHNRLREMTAMERFEFGLEKLAEYDAQQTAIEQKLWEDADKSVDPQLKAYFEGRRAELVERGIVKDMPKSEKSWKRRFSEAVTYPLYRKMFSWVESKATFYEDVVAKLNNELEKRQASGESKEVLEAAKIKIIQLESEWRRMSKEVLDYVEMSKKAVDVMSSMAADEERYKQLRLEYTAEAAASKILQYSIVDPKTIAIREAVKQVNRLVYVNDSDAMPSDYFLNLALAEREPFEAKYREVKNALRKSQLGDVPPPTIPDFESYDDSNRHYPLLYPNQSMADGEGNSYKYAPILQSNAYYGPQVTPMLPDESNLIQKRVVEPEISDTRGKDGDESGKKGGGAGTSDLRPSVRSSATTNGAPSNKNVGDSSTSRNTSAQEEKALKEDEREEGEPDDIELTEEELLLHSIVPKILKEEEIPAEELEEDERKRVERAAALLTLQDGFFTANGANLAVAGERNMSAFRGVKIGSHFQSPFYFGHKGAALALSYETEKRLNDSMYEYSFAGYPKLVRSDLPEEYEAQWTEDEQSAHIVAKFPDHFAHARLLAEDVKRMQNGEAEMSEAERDTWLKKTREERVRLVLETERLIEERREREAHGREISLKKTEDTNREAFVASLEQFAPPPPPTEASDGTVDTSLSRKLAEKYLSGLKDELDAKKDEEEKLFTSDEKQLEDKEDDSFALRVRKNTQERPIRYLTHEEYEILREQGLLANQLQGKPVPDRYADLQEVFDKVAEEAAKSDEDVKREQEEAAAEAAKERARDDRALVLRSTGMGSLSLRKEDPLEKPKGIMAFAGAAISKLAESIFKKVDLGNIPIFGAMLKGRKRASFAMEPKLLLRNIYPDLDLRAIPANVRMMTSVMVQRLLELDIDNIEHLLPTDVVNVVREEKKKLADEGNIRRPYCETEPMFPQMEAYYKFPGTSKIAFKYRTTVHLKHYYVDSETGEPLEPLDTELKVAYLRFVIEVEENGDVKYHDLALHIFPFDGLQVLSTQMVKDKKRPKMRVNLNLRHRPFEPMRAEKEGEEEKEGQVGFIGDLETQEGEKLLEESKNVGSEAEVGGRDEEKEEIAQETLEELIGRENEEIRAQKEAEREEQERLKAEKEREESAKARAEAQRRENEARRAEQKKQVEELTEELRAAERQRKESEEMAQTAAGEEVEQEAEGPKPSAEEVKLQADLERLKKELEAALKGKRGKFDKDE